MRSFDYPGGKQYVLVSTFMNILVVDDSASMRQMIEFTLKSAQHEVASAENGEQGFAVAQQQQFGMIITDVNMPEMNGYQMVESIRGLANYKSVPIVMLTTESDGDAKQKGKAAGATGWIVKPFNPDQLLKIVDRFV